MRREYREEVVIGALKGRERKGGEGRGGMTGLSEEVKGQCGGRCGHYWRGGRS